MTVSKWDSRTIDITHTWGEAGKLGFDPSQFKPQRFTLNGIYRPVAPGKLVLSHYEIGFDTGRMVDYWARVSLYPVGSGAVPRLSGLPPWDGSAKTKELYDN